MLKHHKCISSLKVGHLIFVSENEIYEVVADSSTSFSGEEFIIKGIMYGASFSVSKLYLSKHITKIIKSPKSISYIKERGLNV